MIKIQCLNQLNPLLLQYKVRTHLPHNKKNKNKGVILKLCNIKYILNPLLLICQANRK